LSDRAVFDRQFPDVFDAAALHFIRAGAKPDNRQGVRFVFGREFMHDAQWPLGQCVGPSGEFDHLRFQSGSAEGGFFSRFRHRNRLAQRTGRGFGAFAGRSRRVGDRRACNERLRLRGGCCEQAEHSRQRTNRPADPWMPHHAPCLSSFRSDPPSPGPRSRR